MAVTSTIEYCTDREVQDVFPSLSGFDLKRRIINFTTTDTTNMYKAYNTGLITQLYFDGIEGTAVTDDPNANYEFRYSSGNDSVELFISTASPNDMIIEAGDDWVNIKTRFRRKASRFVESMLDSRIAREISKDREGNYPEVIVRMTSLKTVIFLLQAHDPNNEFIDPFQSEFAELLDGIRAGHIVLPNQVTADSSKGIIRHVSVNGSTTLYPVELKGQYKGYGYDLLKVYIDTSDGGSIGTAKMSVKAKDSDKLKNDVIVDSEIITGDFQNLTSGLQIRWSAGVIDGSTDVATAGDEYEIELYSASIDASVSNVGSVGLTRGGRGYYSHTRKRRIR